MNNRFTATNQARLKASRDAEALAKKILNLLNHGKIKDALALKSRWKAAKRKYEAISALYQELTSWTMHNPPRLSRHSPRYGKKKPMSRRVFDTLDPKKQMNFILTDGIVVE